MRAAGGQRFVVRKRHSWKIFEQVVTVAHLKKKDQISLETNCVEARTFKIERITLYFHLLYRARNTACGPALEVLKHHYITKRTGELLIGNSRFLIYNLLNQLLYYTL